MRRVTLEELRSIAAAIKERPMLFSTPMVRALLEGRKTQTRRIIKERFNEFPYEWYYRLYGGMTIGPHTERKHQFIEGTGRIFVDVKCPYGQVGDILWVRETWMKGYELDGNEEAKPSRFYYAADKDWQHLHWCYDDREEDTGEARWKPSIHMPKAACRLRLKIADIKVERLQDISEEDAKAEGVQCGIFRSGPNNEKREYQLELNQHASWVDGFKFLWYNIHGEESWNANPWVWVISFEKLKP